MVTANKSLQLGDILYHGEHGNQSVKSAGFDIPSTVGADDTVDLFYVPSGFEIVDAHVITAALGSTTKLKLGHRFADGTSTGGDSTPAADSIIGQTAVLTAAARNNMSTAPIKEMIKDSIVYATINTPNGYGRLDAVLKYKFLGTK